MNPSNPVKTDPAITKLGKDDLANNGSSRSGAGATALDPSDPVIPLTFNIPPDIIENLDIRFSDVCSIDVEPVTSKITVTVASGHELFENIPREMREYTAMMIAAMAAATITDSGADPESMVELSLERLMSLANVQ